MSFERAMKFCELCCEYERDLNEIHDDKSLVSEKRAETYINLRDLSNLRAMRALERMEQKGSDYEQRAARILLEECHCCRSESPRIKEMIEDNPDIKNKLSLYFEFPKSDPY